MEASLIRNGYNVERRKMYIQNPRHNLRSSVDMFWQNSLIDRKNNIVERNKQKSSEEVKNHYEKAINHQIDQNAKMNKSTFRVMPAVSVSSPKRHYRDSLHEEVSHYDSTKKYPLQKKIGRHVAQHQIHKRQALSKSVFGYDISPDNFKKQSYLSMVLGDRLAPYLPKEKEKQLSHKSLAINHPVPLNY